ncbi:MAG: AbrB/MazE/SpoVT family DNA-binding domain-containing protein [Candidatus Methylomirabilota bacterium]
MVSRISSKGQITLPKGVRESLGLRPGDPVAYELGEGIAILRKAEPLDVEYHRALTATLSEWSSPADDEAFRDL